MESLVSIGRDRTVQTAVLILVSLLLFANTLPNGLVWDDTWLIADNEYIRSWENIRLFFTPRYWTELHPIPSPGQYRPIRTLTFAVDYFFWEDNPFGYHLTNLFLHMLNVLVIYMLLSHLLIAAKGAGNMDRGWRRGVPFLAALLFAAHPVHTESVNFIKNRAELLAGLFFLLSLSLFIKTALGEKKTKAVLWGSFSMMFFGLALLCKETALALPPILIAWAACFCSGKTRTSAFIKTVPFWAVVPVFFWFRYTFLQTVPVNACASPGLWQNALAVSKTLGYYFYLLCFPVTLNADIPFVIPETIFCPAVFLPALTVFMLGLLIVMICRRKRVFCFSLFWIFLTLVPIANLVYLSSRPLAEQRLYLPSLGFCLLLAFIFSGFFIRRESFFRGQNLIAIVCLSAVFSFYAVQTVSRNRDWQNERTFFSQMVAGSPQSARAHIGRGYALVAAGRLQGALKHYYVALSTKPETAEIHYNLGIILSRLGMPEPALRHFLAAARLQPENAEAHYQAGNIYLQQAKTDKALTAYRQALILDPDYAPAHYNLGIALTEKNRPQEAMNHYRTALQINPDHADAHHKLGVFLAGQGHLEEALWHFFAVTRLSPQKPDAYYNIGSIYKYQGKAEKARRFLAKARTLGATAEEAVGDFP